VSLPSSRLQPTQQQQQACRGACKPRLITTPWCCAALRRLLANLYNGNVYLWNYNDSVSDTL
jgi:hypothetical protein